LPATRRPAFDAAALKREFPGLADPGLDYLDSAATAQVAENALRRFEVEIRANVHEALMRRRSDRRLRPGARRWAVHGGRHGHCARRQDPRTQEEEGLYP